jgi:hypothetical protein
MCHVAKGFFIAFLCTAVLPALACDGSPPELTKHHRDLVDDTTQIVLARARIPKFVAGELRPAFDSIEVLKGEVPEHFVLESRDGLDVSPWGALTFAGEDSDFDGHRHIAFWDQGLTRQWNDTDCVMRPRFELGETYLLFIDHPHWRAYELIRRDDDLWLKAVRSLVADPSRRSGLSVTVPQWLSLAPRAFVSRLNNCEVPNFEVVDVLLGEGEATFPNYRLQRPGTYYGSRQDCEVGMSFLTLVYYQSEADPNYVVSANFDVDNGTVDFSKAIDGEETELDVTGSRAWSLDDLKTELAKLQHP